MTFPIVPVKRLAECALGKMLQSNDRGGDVLALYLRAANVQPDGVMQLEDRKSMWFAPSELAQLTLERGDVVVVEGGIGGYGRAALVTDDLQGWGFQNSIIRLRPFKNCDGRFLAYALIGARERGLIAAHCNIVSMPHFTADKVASFGVPYPDAGEQRAIADFLDEQTSRIDTLIDKQTQLITTLRERLEAATTVTVHDVQAPQLPLRRVAREITDGAHVSPETDGGKYDFVSTRDITSGVIDFEGALKTSAESYAYMVHTGCRPRKGDILFAKDGTVGPVAIVDRDHSFVVASSLVIIRLDPRLALPSFVDYALRSAPATHQASTYVRGAGLPRISVGNVARLRIPVPRLERQREVSLTLDKLATHVADTIDKTQQHIALAKERRAALITAAVTGQIDVRTAGRATQGVA